MKRLASKWTVVVAVLIAVGPLQGAPAYGQDWSVKGGDKRRREIIGRYQKLLERKPVEGMIFKKLIGYVGRGNGLEALVDHYKGEVADHPDTLKYRLILGHLYKAKNDYDAAFAQYDKAVEVDKTSSIAWLSRGSAQLLLQHENEAAADFQKALGLEDDPDRKKKILRKLADAAFSQHDWERAEKYYDQLIDLDPRNEYLRMEYAQVLVKYKRYKKALAQYDKLLELAGRDTKKRATTLRDKGDVYERMGASKQAIQTYRKAMGLMRRGHWLHNELRHRIVDVYRGQDKLDELVERYQNKWRHPNYNESMILAKLYDELGHEKKALKYFKRASRRNRRKVDPRLKIIRILQRRGQPKRVIDAYQSLIRVAPGQHQFQFDLAQLYLRMGDKDKAKRQLARIASRFRSDPQAYLKLADTYMRYGMRHKAQKAYERLVRLEPSNESYILSLGEFYYRSSKTGKARRTWKKILDSQLSDAEAHALLGQTYAEHGLIDDGIGEYLKAVELAPDDLTIRRGLALNYERARQFEQAVAAWRHIMNRTEASEARAEARSRIIGVYEQQGKLGAKMDEFEAAFGADEPDEQAGYFLAEAYLKRKEYQKAEGVFDKLIDLDGKRDEDDLDAFEALLRIYDQTGQQEEAIAALETMAELRPELSRDYFHRIAELSLELYQDKKAVQYARRAVEQNPDDATAHARLGDVYRQMQRFEAATKQYRAAIDLDPRAFGHYMKLATLYTRLGKFGRAEQLYRTVVTDSRDAALILKAGRRAMEFAESDGRLSELEMQFSPLLFSARSKPVYRKLMLELYAAMISPVVTRLRYGMSGEREETRSKLATLASRALPALLDAVQSDDIGQRATAIRLLGDLRAGPAASTLARIAVDPNDSLRGLAALSLARIGDKRGSAELIRALDHDDAQVHDMATWALGYTGGGRQAVDALVDVINQGQDSSQKALAAVSLGRIGGERAAEALVDELSELHVSRPSQQMATALLWAIGRTGSERGIPALGDRLDTGSKDTKAMAAWSLARIGSEAALRALLDAYWSDVSARRTVGGRGLVQMAGRDPEAADGDDRARLVEGDAQYFQDRRQKLDIRSLINGLGDAADAVDVTPEGDFIAGRVAIFADLARDRLKSGNARVKQLVVRDLADMASPHAFGMVSPTTAADRQAVDSVINQLHGQLQKIAAGGHPDLLRPTARLLGDIADPADADVLLGMTDSDQVGIRQAAVRALGKLPTTPALIEAVESKLGDDSFAVRAAAAVSLGRLVGQSRGHAGQAVTALMKALDDNYRAVREAAAKGLAVVGTDTAITGLGRRLDGLSFPVKLVALRALSGVASSQVDRVLDPYRHAQDMRLRRAAAGE